MLEELQQLRRENALLKEKLRGGAQLGHDEACPLCGRGQSAPVSPPARDSRSDSDGSRRKVLPTAPSDSDEDRDIIIPHRRGTGNAQTITAHPSAPVNQPAPPPRKDSTLRREDSGSGPTFMTSSASASTLRQEGRRERGSLLAALDPKDLKRQMIDRYGDVDLHGNRSRRLSQGSEEVDDDDDDDDAPEPPPKPARISSVSESNSTTSSASVIPPLPLSSSATIRSKSPRALFDSGKKTLIPGDHDDSTSSGAPSPPSPPPEKKWSFSRTAGLAVSQLLKRQSGNMDDQSDDSSTTSIPTSALGLSTDGIDPNIRSHSLMDPAESLNWRRQAIGVNNGGKSSVVLTPINCTTINKTNYYLVRVAAPDTSWVVPRTFEQFRDFRASIMFEFPTANLPAPPVKLFKGNVKEKTVGDRLLWLQTFLDALLADSQLAGSILLLKFLDPFYRPSPLALRAIAPVKEGNLMFRSDKTLGKTFKPMLCILKHDLYVFKSIDDQTPFEVVPLDYCTIDLVADTAEIPRFAFQIVSLKEGEMFLFAATSSKDLADWILNLRELKSRRASFCLMETPATYPAIEELAKKRADSVQLLTSYAKGEDVRIDAPAGFLPAVPPDPENGLSVDVKGGILAATPQKLVHVVFDIKRSDKSFVPVFLVAFRYVSTPPELFSLVKDKYARGNVDTRYRVAYLLERWISCHFYDFLDSVELTKCLLAFLATYDNNYCDLKTLVGKKLASLTTTAESHVAACPQPILPQIFRSTAFDLLDLAPLEVARQITLLQHGLLAKIDAKELLQERWTGPEGPVRAPNVAAFIANFNHLCGWISSLIVCTRPPIPRISLMHRCIDIAKCCLELQNYNAVQAILGALGSAPVHRLKEDWDAIPKDSMDTFNELKVSKKRRAF